MVFGDRYLFDDVCSFRQNTLPRTLLPFQTEITESHGHRVDTENKEP